MMCRNLFSTAAIYQTPPQQNIPSFGDKLQSPSTKINKNERNKQKIKTNITTGTIINPLIDTKFIHFHIASDNGRSLFRYDRESPLNYRPNNKYFEKIVAS